jgi:ABC-2 type transport system ATP-binding protein
MTTALEATGLGRRYRRTWALQDCTLAVPAGHVVALVGPNGAGKSTLMNLAVGLTRPTTGTVRVLGHEPGSLQARVGVSYVAQDTPLYGSLSVADTFRLAAKSGLYFDQNRAERHVGDLDIPLGRKVSGLSGGQQAQVSLAVALARRPQLLVLDEPVAKLDPLARHDFMGTLMAAVAEDGVSVLLSSHVVAELERLCDYLVVLARGHVQLCGPVEDLIGEHRLLTGPTATAGDVEQRACIVDERRATGQTSFLARGIREQLPSGWEDARPSLEDVVLSYLRSPEAAALHVPRRGEGVAA